MLNWGVLWDTGGDGNLVCIDLQSGAVLFHEREWSFYEPYINGYLIAASVNGLIEGWGNVCFLNFPGCPGDCPAHGGSAIPDYDRQEYNMSNEAKRNEADSGSLALTADVSAFSDSDDEVTRSPPSWLHGERATAMASSVQLTRSTSLNLTNQSRK